MLIIYNFYCLVFQYMWIFTNSNISLKSYFLLLCKADSAKQVFFNFGSN